MMIEIVFNDEKISTECGLSVTDFLTKNNITGTSFAIAINRTFVPRTRYEATLLNANDIIDIITPMQGG